VGVDAHKITYINWRRGLIESSESREKNFKKFQKILGSWVSFYIDTPEFSDQICKRNREKFASNALVEEKNCKKFTKINKN
jgi:hypothetical protein